MNTLIIAVVLSALAHIYGLRQVRKGRFNAILPDGSRTSFSLLLGYPLSIAVAAIIASTWIAQYVPFVPVTEIYTLRPVGTADASPTAFVQARGEQVQPVTYLLRYQDGQGRIGFESIDVHADVKIYEDVGAEGGALIEKTHKVRDTRAAMYNWALFDDGDRIDYSYRIHVPQGSVEVRLGSN